MTPFPEGPIPIQGEMSLLFLAGWIVDMGLTLPFTIPRFPCQAKRDRVLETALHL